MFIETIRQLGIPFVDMSAKIAPCTWNIAQKSVRLKKNIKTKTKIKDEERNIKTKTKLKRKIGKKFTYRKGENMISVRLCQTTKSF